ncbi:MAG: hypothetical protein IJ773_12815 [Lachnospiraceae bacterium]|nr:hypothetical protein [Lachnospiraceae bacterium]
MEQKKWTSYGEIYDTIVAAIRHDYAGGERLGNRHMPYVGARLSLMHSRPFHGDDSTFFQDSRYYLGALGDPNLQVFKAEPDSIRDWDIGIRARACEDGLFVTKVREDSGFWPGDEILRIGNSSPEEIRKDSRSFLLYGDVKERELWDYYLRYAPTIEVRRNGEKKTVRPHHFPVVPENLACIKKDAQDGKGRGNDLIFRPFPDNAIWLRLRCLPEKSEMELFLKEHEEQLDRASKLILDLRECKGGDLSGILPLIPYLTDSPMTAEEFMGDQGLYIRYSHKNVIRITRELEVSQGSFPVNSEDYLAIQAEKERVQALKGCGFVWEAAEFPAGWRENRITPKGPLKVILLADIGCRDEGELFYRMAARQDRVVTMGRSTLGNTDYQEKMVLSFEDDLFFSYPIGMTREAYEGKGILRKGAPVDLYIPWSREEIGPDLILEKALQI